jgi:hypothetical protein
MRIMRIDSIKEVSWLLLGMALQRGQRAIGRRIGAGDVKRQNSADCNALSMKDEKFEIAEGTEAPRKAHETHAQV